MLQPDGGLDCAVADTAVLDRIEGPTCWEERGDDIGRFFIVDANPPLSTLVDSVTRAFECGVTVFFEPTSVPKAKSLKDCDAFWRCVTFVSPNWDELISLASEEVLNVNDTIEYDETLMRNLVRTLLDRMNSKEACILLTLGDKGVVLAQRQQPDGQNSNQVAIQHFLPLNSVKNVVNCTGAGDSFCGGFVHALLKGYGREDAVRFGMSVAEMSLDCDWAVSPMLSEEVILVEKHKDIDLKR